MSYKIASVNENRLPDASRLPANAAIAAVWDLRERLRFLAALQAESQRQWKRKHGEKRGHELSTPAAATLQKTARKVAAIRGA